MRSPFCHDRKPTRWETKENASPSHERRVIEVNRSWFCLTTGWQQRTVGNLFRAIIYHDSFLESTKDSIQRKKRRCRFPPILPRKRNGCFLDSDIRKVPLPETKSDEILVLEAKASKLLPSIPSRFQNWRKSPFLSLFQNAFRQEKPS